MEITGLFRFKQSNVQLDMVSLMDVSNVRDLAGMVVGSADPAQLTSEERQFWVSWTWRAFSNPPIPCSRK